MAANNKAGDDSQTLPNKESNLFRQVVKFYETKQYKKGLKAADAILKKAPEHGETLSMKGLTLNCMERKEEAYELVRRGLKANLRSHVCWHVYGLLYRSDRNYAEAIKCYINALRMDKDNTQILRDLALLQVQMRDAGGFVDTRQKLLQLKPNNRNNWISFAIAHHLNKSHDMAVQVIEAYEGTIEEVPASEAYEHSEMLLYKATILAEAGKLAEALAVLDTAAAGNKIKDRLGMKEQRAALLLQMGRTEEAREAWRELVKTNPDNTKYHEQLQAAAGLVRGAGGWTDAQREELSAMYADMQAAYPASLACKRMPLDFKEGDSFREAAAEYVKKFLVKGIPSLFTDLKGLYASAPKVAALQALFEELDAALGAGQAVPGLEGAKPSEDGQTPQVWVWMYLAQHHDRLRNTEQALAYAEKVVEAAPTLIEGHSVRSKILKHAGDVDGAAAAAEAARKMDLADRYLNSTCAKALFRAGQIEAAEKTAALFTKDNDQVNSLFDMQCMWYEVECARAHVKAKSHGKALKNFLAVVNHFADFIEDQFDFHSYCVRKMTLRAYVNLLALEDRIMSNVFYSKAAIGAVAVYLALHDRPDTSVKDAQDEEALMAAMDPAERKRYKAKKRKEEARRRKAEEEEAAAAAAAAAKEKAEKGKKGAAVKEKDPDPAGKELAATKDPLGEATKLVVELKKHAADKMETHKAAFEVYLRKGRLLLALQAVKAARKVGGAEHPDAFCMLVRMVDAVARVPDQGSEGAPSPVVHAVIGEEVQELLGGQELAAYVAGWVEAAERSESMPTRAAAAEMSAMVAPSGKAKAVKLLAEQPIPPSATHQDCVHCHGLLATTLADEAAAAKFMAACASRFPWSAHFGGAKRQAVDLVELTKSVKELKV